MNKDLFTVMIKSLVDNGYTITCNNCGEQEKVQFASGVFLPDDWRIVVTYWPNKTNGGNLSRQFEITTMDQPIFCSEKCMIEGGYPYNYDS